MDAIVKPSPNLINLTACSSNEENEVSFHFDKPETAAPVPQKKETKPVSMRSDTVI